MKLSEMVADRAEEIKTEEVETSTEENTEQTAPDCAASITNDEMAYIRELGGNKE